MADTIPSGQYVGVYTDRKTVLYFLMPRELAEVLRDGIKKSGKSANTIAKDTGVPQPTITRFLAGADMKLSTASKIAGYLGLELKRHRAERR